MLDLSLAKRPSERAGFPPIPAAAHRDGDVRGEDADREHSVVEVVEEVGHALEEVLADLGGRGRWAREWGGAEKVARHPEGGRGAAGGSTSRPRRQRLAVRMMRSLNFSRRFTCGDCARRGLSGGEEEGSQQPQAPRQAGRRWDLGLAGRGRRGAMPLRDGARRWGQAGVRARPTSPLSGHFSKYCSASITIIWTYVFMRWVFRDSAKKRNCAAEEIQITDQARRFGADDGAQGAGCGRQARCRRNGDSGAPLGWAHSRGGARPRPQIAPARRGSSRRRRRRRPCRRWAR